MDDIHAGGKKDSKGHAILSLVCAFLLVNYGYGMALQKTSVKKTQRAVAASLTGWIDRSRGKQSITGRLIWSGQSGGFRIWWTTDDLFVLSARGIERIWRPLAERGRGDFAEEMRRNDQAGEKAPDNCGYQRDFKLLSVVGTLVSFQDDEYSYCGGVHPTTYRRFTAIDLATRNKALYFQDEKLMDAALAKPGRVAKLTEYFDEQDVLSALLADRFIRRVFAQAGVSAPPRTLAKLTELFAENDYIIDGSDLELSPDFLSQFAFHHLAGNKVAVRLNLPSLASAYRARQIGLLLPITLRLQQALALADVRKEGFLMKDATHISHNQFTRFVFKVSKEIKNVGHNNSTNSMKRVLKK